MSFINKQMRKRMDNMERIHFAIDNVQDKMKELNNYSGMVLDLIYTNQMQSEKDYEMETQEIIREFRSFPVDTNKLTHMEHKASRTRQLLFNKGLKYNKIDVMRMETKTSKNQRVRVNNINSFRR